MKSLDTHYPLYARNRHKHKLDCLSNTTNCPIKLFYTRSDVLWSTIEDKLLDI
jgi:hypothetical protein